MKRLFRKTKSETKKLQAVLIDWNGTLSPTNYWSQLEKSEKQSERDLFKIWSYSMFVKHKDKIIPWMKGEYVSEDLLSLVSKETNTDFEFLLKEFVIGCERMEYSSPNIPKLVQDLRDKSIIVGIATNNMDSFTRWTIPYMKLDTLFNEILNSFYLKAMKHDLDKNGQSLFFGNFFNKYDIEPTKCIFIDDGEDKMGVINKLGMNYRRVNAFNTLEQELRNILKTL
ncbi:MAG: hypothetical protein UT24_C0004G0045 [Candidatus Woesebacteria bacterium GW2011_GWB1_39_12]|uniref:Uncharacterized protein n=2 Tax=Candidatus Woeseibacteriota TaxID=1752722 RepID=A0A0G0M5C4_9BACT|nr:MAG: hypothetical protein UT23_C0003G0049 [Candidatus Woesebacteria bacterium GW2011_GWA1_39_12]KKR01482.1 MAG: hypothetical protein UT24_C0004G0045 [Candidatus Woesebacteria bacterium GW2011_GWB1_39_12]